MEGRREREREMEGRREREREMEGRREREREMEGRRERGLTGKGGPCSPGQEEEEGHQIEQEDLVVPEPHTVVHPGTVVVKPDINSERDRER